MGTCRRHGFGSYGWGGGIEEDRIANHQLVVAFVQELKFFNRSKSGESHHERVD